MKKVFKKIKKKATGGGGRSNSPGAASNASSTNAAAVEAADGAAASKKQRTGSSASGLKRGSVTSLLSNIPGPKASSRDPKMRHNYMSRLKLPFFLICGGHPSKLYINRKLQVNCVYIYLKI